MSHEKGTRVISTKNSISQFLLLWKYLSTFTVSIYWILVAGFFFFIQSNFFLWKSLEIDVWRDRWSLLGDGLTGTSIRVSALGTDWPEHLSERPHWGRIDRHIYQSVSIGYLHDCDYQQSSFSAVPYDVITFIIFLFRDDMLNLQHTTHI